MSTNKLMVPTVHLNGTSKDELVRQVRDASQAINRAIKALRDTAPHGRDYYPQGDDAWDKARLQHRARLDKMKEVLNQIDELWEKILAS